MDEPLGALDAMTRDHLHDEIERVWREHGLTVLFVTHNMREAVRLGDRVILMALPGRIVHEQIVHAAAPARAWTPPRSPSCAAELTARLQRAGGSPCRLTCTS